MFNTYSGKELIDARTYYQAIVDNKIKQRDSLDSLDLTESERRIKMVVLSYGIHQNTIYLNAVNREIALRFADAPMLAQPSKTTGLEPQISK